MNKDIIIENSNILLKFYNDEFGSKIVQDW